MVKWQRDIYYILFSHPKCPASSCCLQALEVSDHCCLWQSCGEKNKQKTEWPVFLIFFIQPLLLCPVGVDVNLICMPVCQFLALHELEPFANLPPFGQLCGKLYTRKLLSNHQTSVFFSLFVFINLFNSFRLAENDQTFFYKQFFLRSLTLEMPVLFIIWIKNTKLILFHRINSMTGLWWQSEISNQ